jgi:hypothetical protein
MEHAQGKVLQEMWPKMNTHQHMLCIKSLAKVVQQMTKLKFAVYGSLYFATTLPSSPNNEMVDDKFCIGSHTGVHYWNTELSAPRTFNRKPANVGPCKSEHMWSMKAHSDQGQLLKSTHQA